jgi:hypothetical protein
MSKKTAFFVGVSFSLGAAAAQAEINVRSTAGRVDVHAKAAPLTDVLDRLSRQIGMKVVYEGLPPRQLVTATLEGRTPAEAVLGILEGMGLNYALVLDPSGTSVQTLLMAGAAGPGTPPPPARASMPQPPQIQPREMPVPDPEPEPEPEPEVVEEEAAEGDEGAAADEHPLPGGVPQIKDQPTRQGAPVPGVQPGQPAPNAFPGFPQQMFPSSPFAPQANVPTAPPVGTPQPPRTEPNEEPVDQ